MEATIIINKIECNDYTEGQVVNVSDIVRLAGKPDPSSTYLLDKGASLGKIKLERDGKVKIEAGMEFICTSDHVRNG